VLDNMQARIRAGRGGGGEGPARCRARPAAHPHDAETRRQHAARALGWPRRGVRARRTRGGLSGAHGIGAALVIDDTMSHRHRRPATHTTHRSAAVANRQGRPPRPPARSSRSSRSARASRRRGSLRRKDAGSPRCRRAGCGSHGHTAAWAPDGHDSLRRKPAAQESDHRDSSAHSLPLGARASGPAASALGGRASFERAAGAPTENGGESRDRAKILNTAARSPMRWCRARPPARPPPNCAFLLAS
jgi:hypothetical protein